jgi:hypothetical protein
MQCNVEFGYQIGIFSGILGDRTLHNDRYVNFKTYRVGSNFCRLTEGLHGFPQSRSASAGYLLGQASIAFFQILSNSSFINRPTFQSYTYSILQALLNRVSKWAPHECPVYNSFNMAVNRAYSLG